MIKIDFRWKEIRLVDNHFTINMPISTQAADGGVASPLPNAVVGRLRRIFNLGGSSRYAYTIRAQK